jgi:cytochrome c peroxidase
MKKRIAILAFGTVAMFTLFSCGGEENKDIKPKEGTQDNSKLLTKAQAVFAVLPTSIDNPDNPVTPEKVALGKKLFYDTRLSKVGNNSCNSCHNMETYGVDNLPFSPGDNGGFGGRNSPTVLNAAFHFVQFWDGRAKDVEEQAAGPIVNPAEMAMPSPAFLEKRINGIAEYKTDFKTVFPDSKRISITEIAKAIGAFERTLITPSRFDEYLAGKAEALNDQEKEGLKKFMDNGCITCHAGSQLGGNMFQKFGVHKPYWEATRSKKKDEGKFEVTGAESDKYFFKVPGLRNIEKTWPYFHDGSVEKLEDAVAIMADVQLNKKLNEGDVNDIVAFLKTLTGEVPKSALK